MFAKALDIDGPVARLDAADDAGTPIHQELHFMTSMAWREPCRAQSQREHMRYTRKYRQRPNPGSRREWSVSNLLRGQAQEQLDGEPHPANDRFPPKTSGLAVMRFKRSSCAIASLPSSHRLLTFAERRQWPPLCGNWWQLRDTESERGGGRAAVSLAFVAMSCSASLPPLPS